jgi:hypothetical protein
MKTVLIRAGAPPPPELREIVEGGSTEVAEVGRREDARAQDADRLVEWNGRELLVEDRRLRWPEDEDELRMLFQTGG